MTQARITTKYHIPNLDTEKYASKKRKRTAADTEEKTGEDAPRVPRATLEVKAYDPVSGTTLKFKTEKSADVGRLIAGVGRLGRQMAALPEKAEGTDTLSGTMWAQLTCAQPLKMLLWKTRLLRTAQRQRTKHLKKPSLRLQRRAAAKRRRRARNECCLANIFSCDTASLASVAPIFASLAAHD